MNEALLFEGLLLSSLFIFLSACAFTGAITALMKHDLFGWFLIATAVGSGTFTFGIALAVSTALKAGGYS